jgi:4'-phosphopantetheinyl transferase EntD
VSFAPLLPDGAAVRESAADLPSPGLFPEELRAVGRAVESRRREFATGRALAREAVAAVGGPRGPIGVGPRRQPLWPEGYVGSITHCSGYRAAAVAPARRLAALGIDAEVVAPLSEGVAGLVLRPDEARQAPAGIPQEAFDVLRFSAKESLYKAWFQVVGVYLDFQEAELAVADGGRFSARVLHPETPDALREVSGRWALAGRHVLTAVAVPAR